MEDGMTSYLIIATYNHAAYKQLEANGPEGRIEARATAANLFGRRVRDQAGNYVLDENGNTQVVPAGAKLTDFFTFVGAFPYLPIAGEDPDAEHKRANFLYGWVAIVPSEEKLSNLKDFIAWPDSPFCELFDIHISEIRPLEGNAPMANGGLKRDEEAWREKGLDIYDEQTPAMWR